MKMLPIRDSVTTYSPFLSIVAIQVGSNIVGIKV